MKKLFTTPFRLWSAAVVLAGAGLTGALAFADSTETAPKLGPQKSAPVLTAESKAILEVNGVEVLTKSALPYGTEVHLRNLGQNNDWPFLRLIGDYDFTFADPESLITYAIYQAGTKPEAYRDQYTQTTATGVSDYKFKYHPTENRFALGTFDSETKQQNRQNIELYLTGFNINPSSVCDATGQKLMTGQKYTASMGDVQFIVYFPLEGNTSSSNLNMFNYSVTVPAIADAQISLFRDWDHQRLRYTVTIPRSSYEIGETYSILMDVKGTDIGLGEYQNFHGKFDFSMGMSTMEMTTPGFTIDDDVTYNYAPIAPAVMDLEFTAGQSMSIVKSPSIDHKATKISGLKLEKQNASGAYEQVDFNTIVEDGSLVSFKPEDEVYNWFTLAHAPGEYRLTITEAIVDYNLAKVYDSNSLDGKYYFTLKNPDPITGTNPVASLVNAPTVQLKSGDAIIKGATLTFNNTNNLWIENDGSYSLTALIQNSEQENAYANGPVNKTLDGSWTYTVGGAVGATHTFNLGLTNVNAKYPDDFIVPAATAFTYTTTDQLPDPVFSIKGEWYDVQPGQAYGIDGVNVVRANITNGIHKATACYDYHPLDDGTEADVHGNNDVIEAAFLHGEGYKSSNVIFTRLNGQEPYELQAVKLYCNGKEISYGTYVYAGDILTVEDPNYYYGVTNAGVEALPKTFVGNLTIPAEYYKYIEEGKYQRDWSSNEATTPNNKNVSNTAIQTVKSNASAAFKSSIGSYMFKYSYHPYFPVVSTTKETSGSNLKQDIAIGSTVYVYNNFMYNVDWEYDWHCDIEGEEPTAPNTFPAAIMFEGSQSKYELPGGAMNAPVWDTFVLSAEPNKAINLVMYLSRKDDPTVRTNKVIYTITPKAEVLKEPTLSVNGSRGDVKEGDDVYMGSTLVVTNNNPAEAGHVTVNITKDGEEVPLAQFCGGTEPELDDEGSMRLLVGDSTGEYTITIGMEVSEDFAELTGAPAPVSTTVNVVKWKANEWKLTFDGEDYYPEDDTVPFVSYEGYFEILNTNRINDMPFSMGYSRPIVPVVYIDGREVKCEVVAPDFGVYGLTDYGEHTLSVGYKPYSSAYKTEWFDFPEPMEVKFVLADEALEAPYVEVDGNPLMDLTVTNWSKIRIINPNDVPGVMTLVYFIGHPEMTLEDIAYHGDVKELTAEEDGVNGLEFTLLDENCSSLMLELQSVVIGGDTKYYAPKANAAFNVELYQLLPPKGTCEGTITDTYAYYMANTANSNVPTCTVHYTCYDGTDSSIPKLDSGTELLIGSNRVRVASHPNTLVAQFIVGGYLTAPGCINSEPSYVYHLNGQHTLTKPRLYVHNRPLGEYDLLAPGDVITIENPYQFEFGGEEISWHNPVEHQVTVGGEVVPESVVYQPWSGNWIVTIPSTIGDAPSTNQPGPAGVSARAFDLHSISFTSTLTPKDEHTNAFAAGGPYTYEFNVSPTLQTGVEEISADELGNAEIFTLSGLRMTGRDNLAPGFYIIVRGTTTEKVLIK